MSTTQDATEHQFLVDLSKHLVKPGLYFVSNPNGRYLRRFALVLTFLSCKWLTFLVSIIRKVEIVSATKGHEYC